MTARALIALAMLLAATVCAGRTLHVRAAADTMREDGSADRPYARIERALAAAAPGDELALEGRFVIDRRLRLSARHRGLHLRRWREDVPWAVAGSTADEPLFWLEDVERVRFEGGALSGGREGIVITGASHGIAIESMTFSRIRNRGVLAHGDPRRAHARPDRVRIAGSRFEHIGIDTAGAAINLNRNATNFDIENNLILDSVDGITFGSAGRGHRVRGNVIGRSWREDGIDVKRVRSTGYERADPGDVILIEDNVLFGAAWQGVNVHKAARAVRVRRNLIHGNGREGVAVHEPGTGDVEITGNAIVDNGRTGVSVSAAVAGPVRIEGNVVAANGTQRVSPARHAGVLLLSAAPFAVRGNALFGNGSGAGAQLVLARRAVRGGASAANVFGSRAPIGIVGMPALALREARARGLDSDSAACDPALPRAAGEPWPLLTGCAPTVRLAAGGPWRGYRWDGTSLLPPPGRRW